MTCSIKLGLILIKLGQLNTRLMLIWMSICHLNLIKYYVNFMENFKEFVETFRTLFTEILMSLLSEMCSELIFLPFVYPIENNFIRKCN